jgi:hypothetical protein
LRTQLDSAHATPASNANDAQREAEIQKLRGELQELVRLRGEVTKLRAENKDVEKLRAENQQLRSESQQLRAASAAAANAAHSSPQPNLQAVYRREQWTFSGYQTPEAALVSAIWSMQQGDPKQYFESLTPEEQMRMTKAWEGKSAEEIIAKQKNDTAQISAIRVLQTDAVSDNEQLVTVAIDGVNRQEKVRMQRIGNDWKFGGFIREANR